MIHSVPGALALGLVAVTTVMVVTAISARVAGRVSVVDVAWGPGFVAVALAGALLGDDGRLLHAWMVAAQGDLAVAVYVDVGESGSRTAGPLLEEFLRAAR